MRLDINYKKKKLFKKHKHMKINNTFLNNQQVTEEINREIKKFLKQMTMKHDNSKPMGCSKIFLRVKFIAINLTSRNKKNIEQTT